jgi:hypothetical protein
MIVNSPSDAKQVVILGCGRSVLDLTPHEIDRINGIPDVYALNKFAAFYYIPNIIPKNVWFTDCHPPSDVVLQYVFDTIRRHKVRDVKFILRRPPPLPPASTPARRLVRRLLGRTVAFDYATYSPVASALSAARRLPGVRRMYQGSRTFLVPAGSHTEYVEIDEENWTTGGKWATRAGEKLYQCLTSFTSLLNYVCIRHPGSHVWLVGTDFNSPGYFFDQEMQQRKLSWADWTTAAQKEEKKHFAAINLTGNGTLFDKMPSILDRVNAAGVSLKCNNPNSELVRRGFVAFDRLGGER